MMTPEQYRRAEEAVLDTYKLLVDSHRRVKDARKQLAQAQTRAIVANHGNFAVKKSVAKLRESLVQ
ncbi:MAG: hypothetical protein AAFZ14_02490 [Pseudomonadota bacterium]